MQSSMLKAIVEDFGNGGTIDGDLVVSGDLTVSGGGSLSFDEIIEGTQVIDVTNTEALLVRKNGDGGDVFVVDTTNQKIGINTSSPDFALHVHGASDGAGYVKISDSNTGEGGTDGARIGFNSGVMRIQNFENSDMEFYVNNSTKPLVLESDGSATFSGNLALSATSPQINFSGSAGDYGTFGYTEGDPDVFKWGLFQNSGQLASITIDAVSEASPSARFRFNVGGDTDTALMIDSSKRIGIGGTPDTLLHLQGNNGNASHTLLKIHNNDVTSNTETGQTADIEFSFQGTTDGGSNFVTKNAGAIRAGKESDYFTSSANNMDSFLAFYTSQDNTNTLAMHIDASQNVGIGSSPIVRLGQKLSTATSANYGGASLNTYSTDNGHSSVLDFNKSGNATIGSHTAVADDEDLGYIIFRGSDGVEFLDACYIRANVDGAVTGGGTNDMPGRLTFWTTADGSSSPTERIRIDSSGNVGINATPSYKLDITGPATENGSTLRLNDAISSKNSKHLLIQRSSSTASIGMAGSQANDPLWISRSGGYDLMVTSGGNVGIGTSTPNVQNHTFGGSASQENILLKVQSNAVTNDGSLSTSILLANSTGLDSTHGAKIQAIRTGSGTDDLVFHTFNSSLAEAMRLGSDKKATFAGNISLNKSSSNQYILKNTGGSLRLKHEGSSAGDDIILELSDGSSQHIFDHDGSSTFAGAITSGGNVNIPAGNILYLDGGTDTYIYQETDNKISFATNSGVRLSIDNSSSTFSNIVNVSGAGLKITGQNLAHVASSMTLGHEGSSKSQIRVYGADGTTEGSLEIVTSASDGTPSTTVMLLDSNSRISLSNNSGSGSNNTLFGYLSGNDLTTNGNFNAFFGHLAGTEITTGEKNTMLGSYAGYLSLLPDDCTLVGYNAGGSGVMTADADGTTAVGMNSLSNTTSGAGNTALGYDSLQANTTGARNTAVGYQALDDATVSEDNVALGWFALGGASTSSENKRNVAIGTGSMSGTNAGASENVAIGYAALDANLTADADGNVAIGYYAGSAITEGEGNTIVGRNAADALTTGDKNIAIGRLALSTSQVSSNNIAIGYAAMNNTNDADSNGTVAIGYAALNNVTSGAGNVGVGYEVLKQVTTGKHNTAVGYQSMYNAMNVGDSNTSMGYQSLYSLDPDTDDHGSNTAVGKQSGYDVTTGTGNVLVGANAGNSGSNDLTTGDNNTYIGNEATGASASNSNSTVIGATAIGSGSNTVVLGNASVTDVYMAQDSGATVHTAGIQFPASQAASGGANVLDDYEEGTGSPTVSLTGSGSVTLGTSAGNAWTKVGNIVHFQFEFSITGVSSPVGALTVQLPFTSAGTYYSAGSLRVHSETFDGSPFVAINPNATVAQLKCSKTGSSTTDITPTAGTRYFFGQITYRAA